MDFDFDQRARVRSCGAFKRWPLSQEGAAVTTSERDLGHPTGGLFLSGGWRCCASRKAPKRDGDHGFPCPVLAISTQAKKGDAMKKIIWALAFAITTGMALTTAFGFNLLPLHLI